MDPRHFDSLVRKLGVAATRRGALGAILAGLLAPALRESAEADRKKGKGRSGRGRNNGKAGGRGKGRRQKQRGDRSAASAEQGRQCRREGHPCEGNQECCANLVCIVSGPGNAERCTPCGAAGQPCCDDDACGDGFTCDGGACVACGDPGQLCCEGESCDGRAICDTESGQCAPCGGDGDLCCEDGSCDEGFNCTDDGCTPCGDQDLACCEVGDACGEGQICTQGGQCTACGGLDQPCCAEQACDGGFVCDAEAGECVPCGEVGQACCAGANPCGEELSCDEDGLCSSTCGDEGEACCANGSCGENLVCDEGTCESSCDIGDVVCVIGGYGQCVPGVCCEEGDGPGCADPGETCIAGGCINPNEFRIVLRWDEHPADLDSHLWLPPATPFHVFFNNKGDLDAFPNAELDIDDITGFGPETITIGSLEEGTYIYAIHHFRGTGTIGTSGATVQVFKGASLVAEYEAPTDAPWDGQPENPFVPYNDGVIWWQVFALTYDGTDAVITDINLASNDDFVPYGTPGPFAFGSVGVETALKSQLSGGNAAPQRSRKRKNRRRARR